jgi:hypothetical protein
MRLGISLKVASCFSSYFSGQRHSLKHKEQVFYSRFFTFPHARKYLGDRYRSPGKDLPFVKQRRNSAGEWIIAAQPSNNDIGIE